MKCAHKFKKGYGSAICKLNKVTFFVSFLCLFFYLFFCLIFLFHSLSSLMPSLPKRPASVSFLDPFDPDPDMDPDTDPALSFPSFPLPSSFSSSCPPVPSLPSFRIRLDPSCPSFLFPGQEIRSRILVLDATGAVRTLSGNRKFMVSIVDGETGKIVEGWKEWVQVKIEGRGNVELSFRKMSVEMGNKKVRVKIAVEGDGNEEEEIQERKGDLVQRGMLANVVGAIEPYVSDLICVMKYRLVLGERIVQTFYKDEGGRENAIVISGHLKDADDHIVKNR